MQFAGPPPDELHVRESTTVANAIDRTAPHTEPHAELMNTWQAIATMMRKKDPASTPYECARGNADLLSIFDGPSGTINKVATEKGLTAMPPVDVLTEMPQGILNDVQFATLMIAILECCPGLVILGPGCGA